jgi:MFS transporter, FSR family, fosmidomycin resistance protein
MGFFMVGGEFGFSVGPLLVVATIGYLTLKGLPWLMSLGMLASIILFFRLRNFSTVRHTSGEPGLPFRQAVAEMRSVILPIAAITFITGFFTANTVTYLPTFMSLEGNSFALAGMSLSMVELGGTAGVFLMGLYSDRLGHRNVALWGTLISALFGGGFLLTHGWIQIVMLAGIGMSSFIANPAFLAMIQTHFSQNRSLATGVYMSMSFILRSLVVVIVGMLADVFGLRMVFAGSTLAILLAAPFFLFLPKD